MQCVLTLKMRALPDGWLGKWKKQPNIRVNLLFLIAQSSFEIQSDIKQKTRHDIFYRFRGHIFSLQGRIIQLEGNLKDKLCIILLFVS